jgi:hypothetical protein
MRRPKAPYGPASSRFGGSVPDAARVKNLIGAFPELELLPPNDVVLLDGLRHAIGHAEMGLAMLRQDSSGDALVCQLLASDIMTTMERAGVAVTMWRQDSDGRDPERGESLAFRLTRAVAEEAGLDWPDDAFRLMVQGREIQR